MLLVKSKSKGIVGLLISINAIPAQADIVTPGKPSIVIQWWGVVIVNDKWEFFPLNDLDPIIEDLDKEE